MHDTPEQCASSTRQTTSRSSAWTAATVGASEIFSETRRVQKKGANSISSCAAMRLGSQPLVLVNQVAPVSWPLPQTLTRAPLIPKQELALRSVPSPVLQRVRTGEQLPAALPVAKRPETSCVDAAVASGCSEASEAAQTQRSTSGTDLSADWDNSSHEKLKHAHARAASEIEVKDATIANLRLQAELLNVKESLGRILLRDTEDVDVRCEALKGSVARFMTT